jgi:hypothetical protein
MKLWAFEHTSCIYESAFGLVSLHMTEQKAKDAMERYIDNIKREHQEIMKEMEREGYNFDPLDYTDSRIREVTVED